MKSDELFDILPETEKHLAGSEEPWEMKGMGMGQGVGGGGDAATVSGAGAPQPSSLKSILYKLIIKIL